MDPAALASQISALDKGYNPTDTYNKITTQLGIPDARTRVAALQANLLDTSNAIKAVDPNVTARTSGALVTEAQRGRLVDMERAPLTATYNDQNQAFDAQNNQLQDLTNQATQQAGLAQTDYSAKRQSLADQMATAIKQQEDAAAKAEADRQYAAQQVAAKQAQDNANRDYQLKQQQVAQSAAATPAPPTQYSWKKQTGGGYDVVDKNGNAVRTDLATAVASQGGGLSNLVSLLANGSQSDRAAAAQYMSLIQQNKPTQAYNYLVQHTGAFYTGGGF